MKNITPITKKVNPIYTIEQLLETIQQHQVKRAIAFSVSNDLIPIVNITTVISNDALEFIENLYFSMVQGGFSYDQENSACQIILKKCTCKDEQGNRVTNKQIIAAINKSEHVNMRLMPEDVLQVNDLLIKLYTGKILSNNEVH